MANLEKVLSAFESVKACGQDEWKAKCPCHDDRKASLCIGLRSDKILIHCQTNTCNTGDILNAVGLTWSDLGVEHKDQWWEKNLIDKYDYRSEDGKYLYSKLRYPGKDPDDTKDIKYARITGDNYSSGDGKIKHVLYKLPELVKAINSNKTVFYAEGEKDVHTLNKLGFSATTAGGVSDWRSEFSHYFTGADVVILGDNDSPGRDLVSRISRDLRQVALSVRTVYPSDAAHGDVTDYIEEGHSRDELLELVNQADRKYAAWFDEKHYKVNPGLLTECILNQYHFITARNPGTDTDLLYLYSNGVYKKCSEIETVDIIRKYVPVVSHSKALFSNVSQLIRYGADQCSFSDLNANERIINCKNGILNIDTWELQEHDPSIMSTIQINAEYKACKADKWLNFVNDMCMDADGNIDTEEVNLLQEISGFVLSSIYGYRLKKSFVLNSVEGNTGKSVYTNVHESLLGSEAFTATDFRKLSSSRWATGSCLGKRLVSVGDQGAGEISDSSAFKSMTGGDDVDSEFKGQDPFHFKFTGVIVLCCNQIPYFSDDKGNHLAERLLLLPLRNVIDPAVRDPSLVDKLLQERDGIFYWSMMGLKRLVSNGLRFSPCKAADELMTAYRSSHDTLYDFIIKECELTGDRSDTIRKTDFEDAYLRYCQKNDLVPLLKRHIRQRAAGLGVVCATLHGYTVYRGITFKDFVEVDCQESFDST